MTPLFNEIGSIAGARISPKRLVRFRNSLHCVIAGAQGYETWYTSLGTNRGYWGGEGGICRIFEVFWGFFKVWRSIATFTCMRWTNQPVIFVHLVILHRVVQNGGAGVHHPPARGPQTWPLLKNHNFVRYSTTS